MGDMERFDSLALFSIFKNEDGENLLPFDELAAILDIDSELDVPLVPEVPVVTTVGPGATILGASEEPIPTNVPTTSGGGDSDHTRARGWGSNPSSEGGGGDSGDSDMEDLRREDAEPAPSTQTGGTSGGGDRSGRPGKGGGAKASSGIKKRRQRNVDQMESNRVAQQKYRQRKKQEQSTLQHAVDMLTAQVAALKAVEVRASELEASNVALHATVAAQSSNLVTLQQHSAAQAAALETTRTALSASEAQVEAQAKVILDQQAKLRLQEQVIASLKDRLKERIDEAMEHVVPGTVCEKMVAAVKATLYGAKDVHGLQETLAQLPEHLVTELCKNIFQVCKETWPELRTRCGRQVGGACMTGAT